MDMDMVDTDMVDTVTITECHCVVTPCSTDHMIEDCAVT